MARRRTRPEEILPIGWGIPAGRFRFEGTLRQKIERRDGTARLDQGSSDAVSDAAIDLRHRGGAISRVLAHCDSAIGPP
jgi:hypothetical protein